MVTATTTPAITPQKEAILKTAQDLLAQYGYDGLSIRELAHRCGLATATIYHHFHDKEDILVNVLEQGATAVHRQSSAIAASDLDVIAKLKAVTRLHIKQMAENRFVAMTVMRRVKAMDGEVPSIIRKVMALFLEPISTIIAQGIGEGRLRPVDPKTSAVCLLGMLHTLFTFSIVMAKDERSKSDLSRDELSACDFTLVDVDYLADSIIEQAISIFIHGIAQQDS